MPDISELPDEALASISERLTELVNREGDPYKKLSLPKNTSDMEKVVFLLETIFDDMDHIRDTKQDADP